MRKVFCEACGATYSISSNARSGSHYAFRCTRCGARMRVVVPEPDASVDREVADARRAAESRRLELEASVAALDLEMIRTNVQQLVEAPLSVVAAADIEAFERDHGVTLPSDYHRFLTTIGDRAPGPLGGLIPFGHGLPDDDDEHHLLDDDTRDRIGKPFPGRDTGDEDADDEHNGALDFDDFAHGVVPLASADMLTAWLVVHGTEAGRVWECDGGSWYRAATPLCRPVSFREWYAVWLSQNRR